MKRNLILSMAILAAFALVSCKSTESSYKKAYDKAKQQEQAQQVNTPVQVTPVVTPVQTVTPVTTTQPEDNSDLRTENLTAVSGTLKAYNVVCGSFRSLDNANNLCSTKATAQSLRRTRQQACIASLRHQPTQSLMPYQAVTNCALPTQTLGYSMRSKEIYFQSA